MSDARSEIEKLIAQVDEFDRDAAASKVDKLLSPDGFLKITSGEVTRARRYDRPLSVALVQVDHMGAILAADGTDIAEQVFRDVAVRVIQHLRLPDQIGRLGPGQLGFLLPETGANQATVASERVCQIIAEQNVATAAGPRAVTLSIGVATMSPRIRDAKTFLMKACFELRRAQANGQDRVCVSAPDTARVSIARGGHIH